LYEDTSEVPDIEAFLESINELNEAELVILQAKISDFWNLPDELDGYQRVKKMGLEYW
jgi:hypothetical protein